MASSRSLNHYTISVVERFAGYCSAWFDFEGRFATIRQAAPSAVSEFRAEAAQGRDELHSHLLSFTRFPRPYNIRRLAAVERMAAA